MSVSATYGARTVKVIYLLVKNMPRWQKNFM